MNNTCRYCLKCQPEYTYPFHYLCAPYSNPHAGPGVCWGLFYPRKDCETTHFSVPIADFMGGVSWHVYLYRTREDLDWCPRDESYPRHGGGPLKKRWFLCCANGQDWNWPLDEHGSLVEDDPIWDLDPEWLAYPTPGP